MTHKVSAGYVKRAKRMQNLPKWDGIGVVDKPRTIEVLYSCNHTETHILTGAATEPDYHDQMCAACYSLYTGRPQCPYDDSPDDPIGCIFPGKCCMPGLHLTSECHTAEMMEQIAEEEDGSEQFPEGEGFFTT